jgi:ubiquinone/menaquinone biosynthesis C-methylase UbiE
MSDIDVDLRVKTVEELPFEDGRFDCVVSTWTLCSVRDALQAVVQISRVLKPGVRFLYLEHGLGEEPGVQRWQRRLTPLQKRLAGGYHVDVDIEALVKSGAFRDVQVERFQPERTSRLVGSMYRGVAVR